MSSPAHDSDRRERSRRVCARLSNAISRVAPDGIGRWDRAWELVAQPSDAFLDALATWLDDDTSDTRAALQAAADHLVRAWRGAARKWEGSGPTESAEEEARHAGV